MASIRERPTKGGPTTYAVLYRQGDKQTSTSFEDETIALAFKTDVEAFGPDRAKKMLVQRLKEDGLKRNLTVDELFDKWIVVMDRERLAGEITRGTLTRYQQCYENNIKDYIGNWDCGVVESSDIQDLVDDWVSEGMAPNTVGGRFGNLKKMFDWAADSRQQIINTSPCAGIRLPKHAVWIRRVYVRRRSLNSWRRLLASTWTCMT